ncbi:MAG: nucleoside deaminase [Candidatus Babeliaceae bacterium]|nr:nucleoside deaminase [Candidatus Babeliaceae bacterium]
MEDDIGYMGHALALAEQAAVRGEIPIGAVVVSRSGDIIGEGFNETETQLCQDQHAEMNAIRQACISLRDWRLDGCTIYVTLEPCLMCVGCIVLSRIERIVYGAPSPRFGFCQDREWVHRLYDRPIKNITGGVGHIESRELLKKFFEERRFEGRSQGW